jgi:hypothetical protein
MPTQKCKITLGRSHCAANQSAFGHCAACGNSGRHAHLVAADGRGHRMLRVPGITCPVKKKVNSALYRESSARIDYMCVAPARKGFQFCHGSCGSTSSPLWVRSDRLTKRACKSSLFQVRGPSGRPRRRCTVPSRELQDGAEFHRSGPVSSVTVVFNEPRILIQSILDL